jgi:hypothetical protein
MIVGISSDAEEDLIDGYWFYERQSPGLGDYFRSCLIADIESLFSMPGVIRCGYGDDLSRRSARTLSVLRGRPKLRYGARGAWGDDLARTLRARFGVESVVLSCFVTAESSSSIPATTTQSSPMLIASRASHQSSSRSSSE